MTANPPEAGDVRPTIASDVGDHGTRASLDAVLGELTTLPSAPTDTLANQTAKAAKRMRRMRAYGLILVIVCALGFLVVKGLGNATQYFRTATEATAEASSLGSSRFRLEGIVVDGSVCALTNGVRFQVQDNGSRIEVRHTGNPPELFRPNIPVVLEGRFDPTVQHATTATGAPVYTSDNVMIKHSEIYVEMNSDRVKDYVGKEGVGNAMSPVPISACAP